MSTNKKNSLKRKTSMENPSEKKTKNEDSTSVETEVDETEKAGPSTSAQGKKSQPENTTPKLPPRSILQLKITLEEITPPIWRRIQVLNNITFEELSDNINEAMGWMAPCWHRFLLKNKKKPDESIVIGRATPDLPLARKELNEQKTKLSRFLFEKGEVMFYEYDVAENWVHRVVLERILPPPSKNAWFPKIKAGARACPPHDCGGVDGYNHLVEVYKNPEHEEYEELIKDWLEDNSPGYDPEKFDRKNIFKKVWMWVQT